jgi:hypothetical protein
MMLATKTTDMPDALLRRGSARLATREYSGHRNFFEYVWAPLEWGLEEPANRRVASLTSALATDQALDLTLGPGDIEASPLIAADDIQAHRGEWVILSLGRVVAHAQVPAELFADERASQPGYTIYRVPETQRRFR